MTSSSDCPAPEKPGDRVNPAFAIVGAGQAGGWTARTLRDEGFAGRIVVFGEESFPPYERPPLSKEVLLGEAEKESCFLWSEKALSESGIELIPGRRVVAIDPDAHRLTLDGGESFDWTKLMLAPGGRARTLDVPGADLDGVFTLRTIDDTEAIRPRLAEGASVVVIGAGWIGLEVAAAARKRGASVTVLEAEDRVCARALTPGMSEWVLELHRRHGVEILLNARFLEFGGGARLERAVLQNGSEIACDLAVVGVGLVPNVELAQAAGLDVDNGIVVDETGRTSHPDIYAAGDAANHPNPLLGRRLRLESWENAQNQAIAVAKAMLGGEAPYAEIPWFWSDQYDANIQLMGVPETWDRTVVRGDRSSGEFIEFHLKDGRLQGAAAVNNPRDLRLARRMMMADRTWDPEALADPTIKLQRLLKA